MSDRYKRRDDGSHFDSEQKRDKRGRFVSEPMPKRERAADSGRRPGETDSEYWERLRVKANERASRILSEYQSKPLPKI